MPRLPPAEKLPLAVRKNVRDEWENERESWEKKFSDILGTEWKININPAAIYPYAEENSYAHSSLGACIKSYISGAEYQLKYYVEKFGDLIKDDINTIAHAHVITMDLDEDKLFSYCGVKVTSEGELAIIFVEDKLGTNIDYAMEKSNLQKALDAAPNSKPLNHTARVGIKDDYEPKIAAAQAELNKYLGKEITFDPNFEDTWAKLSASKDTRDDYPTNLGNFALKYLEGLNWYLKCQKFHEDDMLQEGLTEALEGNAIRFRIVDKLSKSYNESVIEDGVLYLQTTAANWGTNIDHVADGLVELL
ncbi:hypothetical protein BGZ63DRAFT_393465 [Mariannaea sp. PMI_226]|nr:hypothetical protein BGZ63DRAFT_393465 [Mariannaea sp. PMI_226]